MNRTRNRAGISLLEVLISTFVLAIGILSLAVLIPVGRLSIQQSIISDRAGTCGRAALRDIKTRGMLEPGRKYFFDSTPTTLQYMPWVVGMPDPIGHRIDPFSFAIDPLFIAKNAAPTSGLVEPAFPFLAAREPDSAPLPLPLPRMRRVTWQRTMIEQLVSGTSYWLPHLPLAERCFYWHDDLAFSLPDAADQRPNALMDNGVPHINGNYSWMVTVTPALNETGLAFNGRGLYSVSVVVFYKRSFTVPETDPATGLQTAVDLAQNPRPSERTVTANILSIYPDQNTGIPSGVSLGGGAVKLTVPGPAYSQYLDVKKGQWLLLSGNLGTENQALGVFRWYRVVSVGDVQPDPPDAPARLCRYVTLAGPDWHGRWCAKNDDGTAQDLDDDDQDPNNAGMGLHDAEAVLMDGVVDVYSTTIELDRSLTWGQ